MAEPDNELVADRLPADWAKGWFAGIWVDAVGNPITGTVTASLSVKRTASAATHTTVFGGSLEVALVDGMPSGPKVTENSAGVLCVEFLTTDDPDIQPSDLQLVIKESWSGIKYYRELLAVNTLENPLWLTGDLTSIEPQPGVIRASIYTVSAAPYVQPIEAAIGDWVVFKKSNGDLVEVYVVS
jgi:hypothetical protein